MFVVNLLFQNGVHLITQSYLNHGKRKYSRMTLTLRNEIVTYSSNAVAQRKNRFFQL